MATAERYGQLRYKVILFGDDYWGTILDEMPPLKNSKGIEMKRYLVLPSPELMKAYPELQKPGMLTYKNYALWVEYPIYWVYDDNPSRVNAIARVNCCFDGSESPITRRMAQVTTENKYLRIEKENLEIANIQLLDEVKKLQGEVIHVVKKWRDIDEVLKGESGKSQNENDIPMGTEQ